MDIEQLTQLLERLQTTLGDLSDIQQQKQRALASMDTVELQRLADIEGELSDRMKILSDERKRLVAESHAPGQSPLTFRELLNQLPVPQRKNLTEKFDRVREQAKLVKQKAAGNWFATYRTHQHVKDLVELISNAGQPETDDSGYQGLFLDSTA